MVLPDDVFDECIAILQNASLLEEEQTEQIEDLIKSRTGLTGQALEAQTLDVLWRHRAQVSPTSSPPPPRATIIRRSSPAPWQIIPGRTGTPVGTPPPGFASIAASTLLNHHHGGVNNTSSPFPSPRPSPLLAYSSPRIPHSPSLNAYEYATDVSTPDIYGDYGSENVAWLVADDNPTNYLSSRGGLMQQDNLTPHDMLRSVLGEGRTDEEISAALETCGYDLSATLSMLMDQEGILNGGNGINIDVMRTPEGKYSHITGEGMTIATGKNTALTPGGGEYGRSPGRPTTPKVGVVCRFFLSTGSCLRADCRFSHDTSSTICKYWVMGSCLAGDTCIFSHDPTQSASKLMDQQRAATSTPPLLQFQDTTAFPALGGDLSSSPYNGSSRSGDLSTNPTLSPPPGFRALNISRPNSRAQNRAPSPMIPSVDDTDAFPSLGSFKTGKKHQNRRNNRSNLTEGITGGSQGGTNIPTGPASLADVVRMSPSPGPYNRNNRFNNHIQNSPPPSFSVPGKHRNNHRNNAGGGGGGSGNGGGPPGANFPLSAAAAAIPPPQQIPWLDTGNAMNKTYLKHRQTAIKHGQLRNKYLSAAAAAWARNDAKAAKSLSNKGQQEQAEMRKAHREAAAAIYEQRQRALRNGAATPAAAAANGGVVELFVDLHGLHPEEAVEYLERILLENQKSSQPLYAITGTGHHSKNGKDKVQRSVRAFLDEWKYVYREFSAQGDRGGMGGILGIDPGSFDKSYVKGDGGGSGGENGGGNGNSNGGGVGRVAHHEHSNGKNLGEGGDAGFGAEDGDGSEIVVMVPVKIKEGKKKKGGNGNKGEENGGSKPEAEGEEEGGDGVVVQDKGSGNANNLGEVLATAAVATAAVGE
ncbi:hypothetical protein TWF730_002454 [Orbilia blumenaviensis]|uniref:Uncharacterized protein n=1 Tax=Orbilia blumenaviensis TaxID=1796055 RepID=A0AAV9UDP8_9PEZI